MIPDNMKVSVAPHTRTEINPYERCEHCGGGGLQANIYNGEPELCWSCRGNGTQRARDGRGRFIGNTSIKSRKAEMRCLLLGYVRTERCRQQEAALHRMALSIAHEVEQGCKYPASITESF